MAFFPTLNLELVGDLVRGVGGRVADVEVDIAVGRLSPHLLDCVPDHDVLPANGEVRSSRSAGCELLELVEAAELELGLVLAGRELDVHLSDLAGGHLANVLDLDRDLGDLVVDRLARLLADPLLVRALGGIVGLVLVVQADARVGEFRVGQSVSEGYDSKFSKVNGDAEVNLR